MVIDRRIDRRNQYGASFSAESHPQHLNAPAPSFHTPCFVSLMASTSCLSPLLARSTIVITQRSALLLACVLAAVVSADRAGIMTCLMNKLRRLSPEAKSDVGCGSNSTDKNLKLELMKNQSKDNFTTAAPGSTCQERGLQEDVDGQCCQAVHMDFKGHCCMVGTLDKVRG